VIDLSIQKNFKYVVQEIKDIFILLNNQNPTPDEEIEAKDKLINKFTILKDFNLSPAENKMINDILGQLKGWDPLEFWFRELKYLPANIRNFVTLHSKADYNMDPILTINNNAEISSNIEKNSLKLQPDITDIVAQVSEQFKEEISSLKDEFKQLKNELELRMLEIEKDIKLKVMQKTMEKTGIPIKHTQESMTPSPLEKRIITPVVTEEPSIIDRSAHPFSIDSIKPDEPKEKVELNSLSTVKLKDSDLIFQKDLEKINPNLVLDVKNLTKIYTLGDYQVNALDKISLQVKKGELVAIVGPSGAGKTTLINCLGALDFPDDGSVVYNIDGAGAGSDITKMNDKEHKEMRLHKIGLIFQFYNLFPILTAYENVELPALLAKKKPKECEDKVKELLNMVGLRERMYHKPTQMSGGEQQRVTVARSMINSPLLVLADEPTGELDTETSSQIMKIFLKLRDEGQSILMVTHNTRIAEVADRIITISDGQLVNERAGGKSLAEIWDD